MIRRSGPIVAHRLPDPWPPEVTAAMRARDGNRCVGPVVGFPTTCQGTTERDHIRASGGLGIKSRSTLDNGALLCFACHRWKTEHGKQARPLLIEYVDRKARVHP